MGSFGWKSPFPIRFGGDAHQPVERVYDSLRANMGTALSDDEDSATAAEDQAFARVLAEADGTTDAFREQSDPRALTLPLLERWEAILGLGVASDMTQEDRRSAVSARLLANYAGNYAGLSRLVIEAFYPWAVRLVLTDMSSARMYWPGGTSLSGYPWYSTIANVCVAYERPASATDDDCLRREASCASGLEEWLPAWATYTLTQTQTTGVNAYQLGFYLDQPNLDWAALRI